MQAAKVRFRVAASSPWPTGVGRVDPLADATVVHWLIATRCRLWRRAASERSNRKLSQKRALAPTHDKRFNRLRNVPSGL